jgi:uncharacterized protein YqgV (UPF0045/DUF77 family)
MDYLLLGAVLLFFLLFFRIKEGYYSDANINASVNSMNTLIGKLNTLKSSLKEIEEYTFSFDAQSKLSPILQIKNVKDYNIKLIQQIKMKNEVLSNHQDNLMQLQESLKNIQKGTVQLKERTLTQPSFSMNSSEYQEPKVEYNSVMYTLKDALDKMLKDSQTITTELNQIPDS